MKANSQTRLAIRIRSDAQRFESLKTGDCSTGLLQQGNGAEADDEVRPQTVRLSPRSRQTSRAVLRVHLQNPEQDRQPAALPRSGASLSNRDPAISQVEVASRTPGTTAPLCSCAPCSAEVDPPQLIKHLRCIKDTLGISF